MYRTFQKYCSILIMQDIIFCDIIILSVISVISQLAALNLLSVTEDCKCLWIILYVHTAAVISILISYYATHTRTRTHTQSTCMYSCSNIYTSFLLCYSTHSWTWMEVIPRMMLFLKNLTLHHQRPCRGQVVMHLCLAMSCALLKDLWQVSQ